MAYETGIVQSIEELFHAVRRFACGYEDIGTIGYAGTGTGTLTAASSTSASVVETWTVTNTVASAAPTVRTHGLNMGAEDGDMTSWTAQSGVIIASASTPQSGTYSFTHSGAAISGTWQVMQQIDLFADGLLAADVDDQAAVYDLTYYVGNSLTGTLPSRVYLVFRDASQVQIGSPVASKYQDSAAGFDLREVSGVIPPLTKFVDIIIDIKGVGNNTAYVDTIEFKTTTYPGRWSVVGGTSGNIGNCSAHDKRQSLSGVSFVLDDPSDTHIVSDAYTIPMTTSAVLTDGVEWIEQEFSEHNYDTEGGYGNGFPSMILKGTGASDTDNIYVGMKHIAFNAGHQNVQLQGYLSYDAATDFNSQVGAIEGHDSFTPPELALHDSTMEYWLLVNSRRILMVVKAGTIYEHMYLGFLKAFYTPGQYPYPLFIGGSSFFGQSTDSIDGRHSAYWNANRQTIGGRKASSGYLRTLVGDWLEFGNKGISLSVEFPSNEEPAATFPWHNDEMAGIGENLDGTYSVFPSILHHDDSAGLTNMYGQFDGVFAVSSRGIVSEDTITIGGDTYKCFQSTFHTGFNDMCAVILE